MSFTRVKVAGWAFGERLTSAQMNALDIDHADAVDGVDGGNYTLSAPLAFTGTVSCTNMTVTADLAVTDDVSVGGDLTVVTAATVQGPAALDDDVSVGGTLSCGVVLAGATTCTGLTVSTDASIGDDLTVTGDINVGAVSTFQGAAQFDDDVTIGGALSCDEVDGRYFNGQALRRVLVGTDANTSVGATTYNFVYLAPVTLTATRTYTISDSGAADGMVIEFVNHSASFSLTVNGPGAVLIGNSSSGSHLVVTRNAGTWQVLD